MKHKNWRISCEHSAVSHVAICAT